MLNPRAMREIELERRLNAPSLICAVHPSGTGIMWIGMSGRKANWGHCAIIAMVSGRNTCGNRGGATASSKAPTCSCIWNAAPVCGLTQMWESWPDRSFDECWTLDETNYEPEGIFIEPEEPKGTDDE